MQVYSLDFASQSRSGLRPKAAPSAPGRRRAAPDQKPRSPLGISRGCGSLPPGCAGSVGVTAKRQGCGFAPVLARSRLRRAAASGLALDPSPFQHRPRSLARAGVQRMAGSRVEGVAGAARSPQGEDTGHPRKAQRPLTLTGAPQPQGGGSRGFRPKAAPCSPSPSAARRGGVQNPEGGFWPSP